MTNIFSGRLELQSSSLVPGETDKWDIVASFVDLTGMFYAMDASVGNIIYNDCTSINGGVLRYEIISIDAQTTFDTLYARVKWTLATIDIAEPAVGFETLICKVAMGSACLPSSSAQQLSESFLQYARNTELYLLARYSLANRRYNAPYIGDKDSSNVIFTFLEEPIPESIYFTYNGMRQRLETDFISDGMNIIVNKPPTSLDTFYFEFNPK